MTLMEKIDLVNDSRVLADHGLVKTLFEAIDLRGR